MDAVAYSLARGLDRRMGDGVGNGTLVGWRRGLVFDPTFRHGIVPAILVERWMTIHLRQIGIQPTMSRLLLAPSARLGIGISRRRLRKRNIAKLDSSPTDSVYIVAQSDWLLWDHGSAKG